MSIIFKGWDFVHMGTHDCNKRGSLGQ